MNVPRSFARGVRCSARYTLSASMILSVCCWRLRPYLCATPFGITDTDRNLEGIASFLADLDIRMAALMRYNPLWHAKADKIGGDAPFCQQKSMTTWMDSARLKRCREPFIHAGIGL